MEGMELSKTLYFHFFSLLIIIGRIWKRQNDAKKKIERPDKPITVALSMFSLIRVCVCGCVCVTSYNHCIFNMYMYILN